jgi:hypothetical protein
MTSGRDVQRVADHPGLLAALLGLLLQRLPMFPYEF